MYCSRFPKSPPSAKWLAFFRQPPKSIGIDLCILIQCLRLLPLGLFNLNGQRKFEAFLKFSPTVKISWTRSSIQMMSCLPAKWNVSISHFQCSCSSSYRVIFRWCCYSIMVYVVYSLYRSLVCRSIHERISNLDNPMQCMVQQYVTSEEWLYSI